MGLFDGLEKLGFTKKIKDDELFASNKPRKSNTTEAVMQIEKKEEDYLFEKRYTCAVCGNAFTEKTVKTGKARRITSDIDLRPRYVGIDAIKYTMVFCKNCGYTAFASSFPHISPMQRKLLKEEIQQNYKGVEEGEGTLTYEEAITRFTLGLYCAVVKRAKNSEKAYICLQLAWLYRGCAEELEAKEPKKNKAKLTALKEKEKSYIEKAHDGFTEAVAHEMFPICGMDEMTFNYLLAALAYHIGKFDECKKLLGSILVSRQASKTVKDRALNLKEIVMEESKKSE